MVFGSTESIYRKGLQALEGGDPPKLLGYAEELIQRQHWGGFELMGRCCLMIGNLPGAIEILQQGCELCPKTAVLWSLLGEAYSNSGRFEEALDAFHHYRQEGQEEETALFNLAVIYGRMKEHEVSLQMLAQEKWTVVPFDQIVSARAGNLMALGRVKEGVEELRRIPEDDWPIRFYALMGEAHYLKGRVDLARDIARMTVRRGYDPLGLQILSRANGPLGEETKLLHLFLTGREEINGQVIDAFVNAYVCADSPEEGLTFVADVFDRISELAIENRREMGPAVGESKGVVRVMSPLDYDAS